MQQSSATPKNQSGCGRLLHALNPPRSAFLFQQFFGTVSSLHPTSFLMIFTLVYIYMYILHILHVLYSRQINVHAHIIITVLHSKMWSYMLRARVMLN